MKNIYIYIYIYICTFDSVSDALNDLKKLKQSGSVINYYKIQ